MRQRLSPARDAGAAAVEFALVSLLLFTFIFGTIGFGRAMWLWQGVSAASREGARYGMAAGGDVPQYLNCAGIRAAARERVPDLTLSDDEIAITYRHAAGGSSECGSAATLKDGDRIEIAVSHKFDLVMPLLPLGPDALTATTSRTLYVGDGS